MPFSLRKLPDPAVIKSELTAVCSHPLFMNAPGAVSLLRFLVENDLRGNGLPLRETTIGIKLYGRDAAYDPKLDAIVRVNANRLRNRLEHYYATQPHAIFRISLPAGGYIPVYEELILSEIPKTEPEEVAPAEPVPPTASLATATRTPFRWWLVLVILITAIAAVALTLIFVNHRKSATAVPLDTPITIEAAQRAHSARWGRDAQHSPAGLISFPK